jgi:hypothetical protein
MLAARPSPFILVLAATLAGAALAPACGTSQPGGMSGPTMSGRMSETSGSVQSDAILARNPATERALVKHILIGWRNLEPAYRGGMDRRGRTRTRADADRLTAELFARATSGEPFEPLMIEHSEDGGSAAEASAIEVTPSANLVTPFKRLSLRLEPGEIGVVGTSFGWHIIKRVR